MTLLTVPQRPDGLLGTFGPRLGHGMIELVAVGGWVVAAVSAGLIVICLATGRGR